MTFDQRIARNFIAVHERSPISLPHSQNIPTGCWEYHHSRRASEQREDGNALFKGKERGGNLEGMSPVLQQYLILIHAIKRRRSQSL
jgi:hypothetical protein